MNSVLAELARGTTELPGGEHVPVHSGLAPESAAILRRSVAAVRPRLACEVGLAFGVSTVHLLDAMAEHGGGALVGMDPAQHDATWRGGGLHNVRRAGFADRYTFHERTSQDLLPELARSGLRIQLALVDGWHTFDHALVDFFYLDRMLEPKGHLLLDDVQYPALHRLAQFIVTNRGYTVVEAAYGRQRPSWRRSAKRLAQRALHPLIRDDRTPGVAAVRACAPLEGAHFVALAKTADDRRAFDHFVHF